MAVLTLDHAQLAMPAGGEALARTFYGGVLELTEVAKPPALAVRGGCWFERGAVRIHLGVEPDFRPARKAHVALLVDDLDAILDRARNAGCEINQERPLGASRQTYVYDLFGNRLELLCDQ